MAEGNSEERASWMASSQLSEGLNSSQSLPSGQTGSTTPSGTSSGVQSTMRSSSRHKRRRRASVPSQSFSKTTGSVDSQTSSTTSIATLKQLKQETRQVSEKLGSLLNSRPYVGQTEQFKQELQAVSQSQQLSLESVINYPMKRYNDRTCVHLAATNGLWECLEILLKSGGNPNAISSLTDLCQTPLHLAADKGFAKCSEILLNHGADMMLNNSQQNKPVDMIRGKKTCEQVFQQAMSKEHIPKRSKEQQQTVSELHSLLKDGQDPVEFYQLYDSLPPDHWDLSTRWTDWDRQTLLYRACAMESVDIVEHILSKSPKHQPLRNTSNECNPLHIACQKGNIEIAKKLLSHSPKLLFHQAGKEKLSPLHIACCNGNSKMVQLILDQIYLLVQSGDQLSLSLDATDHLGHTPFFYACARGDTAIVKLLTEFQAKHSYKVTLNVNSAEPYQSTPLHAAVQSGIVEVVEILLHVKGINLNAKARPAERTQKCCLHILEQNLHGGVIPVEEAAGEKKVCSTDATPGLTSPPSGTAAPNISPFYTPPSTVKRDISDPLGISLQMGSEIHASSEVHNEDKSHGQKKRIEMTAKPKRFSKKPLGGRSHDTTPADTINLVDTSMGIFETEYGKLEVLPVHGSSGYKSFNQLLVTPLTEACAYGNTEMVNLLLQYGAQDDDGLAHRISSFIHLPDIAQLVLAHQCIVLEKGVGEKGATDTAARLQLQWDSRNLSVLDGSWFSNTFEYFPSQRQKEDDDGDTGYSSRLRLPQLQLQYKSSVTGFNIRVVHLQQNHLQSIPLEMFYLPNVEEIDLSRNRCTELPEDVGGWKCVHLKELDLSHNFLVSFPSSVWVLPALRKLVATHNNLATLLQDKKKKFEEELLSKSLEHIDVSYNHLIELPSFLFLLPKLKKAFLHHNELQSLPDTAWDSTTIKELLINHNHLTHLPRVEPVDSHFSESACKAPDVIQRSERAITGIFEVRARFDSSLSKNNQPEISICGTRPVTIKQDVLLPAAGVDSSEYSSLTKLNIANNRLQTFPVGLPCFVPNLTELDVSNNSFKDIDIQFIPQLIVKFTARNCEIKRFGNVLTQASNTEVVKCCLHQKTFGYPCQHRKHPRLPNLTNLKLSGNRLKYFQILYHEPFESDDEEPIEKDQIFDPTKTSMDLLYPALEALELSRNNLQGEFNPNIGHQSHLMQIQLDRNPELRKIPMEFAYLRKTRQLTELRINDLPNLIEPPQEYQNKQHSINHLLTYMRSRLKESQQYRTIKLFIIGNERRGKTTLCRRLKSVHEGVVDRTVGIDIKDWIYSEPKKFLKSASKPVHFLIWDFAGQGVYHTSHQCFYSRRALYLALFRLTDDIQGVEELEPWLRNVQLRAPGCPVIIVGTHLDRLADEQRAIQLQKLALEKYKDTSFYPKIVSVEIVSSMKSNRVFSISYIEKLRRHIYNVACHLQVSSDGGTLEYKPDMPQDDPKALLQQKIPASFLNLQDAIRQDVTRKQSVMSSSRTALIMDEKTFKATFKDHCEDEDELNEAVYFLHMQGTILHFEEHGLRDVYFLDPQWLAKLMANVIYPAAQDESSPIQNGIGKTGQLFTQQDIPDDLKEQYIHLLEKFELAMRIGHEQVIIPSLMQDYANYPPISSCPSDLTNYKPPLRRFWVSNYIPDGFWPRLICRIASDQQINKVLLALRGETQISPEEGGENFKELNGCSIDDVHRWIPWKTGIAHAQQERTLVVIKQGKNEKTEENLKWMQGTFMVELHIYVPEWIMLAKEHGELNYSLTNPNYVLGLATSLIVMISQHVRALGSDWFPGMFLTPSNYHQFTTYMPCWKCFAQIEANAEQQPPKSSGGYISKDGKPIYSFIFEESVVPAIQQKDMECPLHGLIKVVEIAPDLIFWDLQQLTYPHEADMTLKINTGDVLGKGGYGFVCKGELAGEHDTKTVAVKVFLQKTDSSIGQSTIAELLNVSLDPRNLLHAYQEIRQEIAILANLNHPNLTELCGVRTHPHMCLLLELAPKTSLRAILKEYKECNLILEPLTLKTSAVQIAAGLEYLHRHQVVHLDIKSANVLVWYFPSPKHDGIITSRQERMKLAGNVWLKLADYGISRVSTTSTIKLPAVGTPGYMAPEVFHTGQQVSSEKVDVFAFGMTLYELLSQKFPFNKIVPAIKRNREVINKHRPLLEAKETRSLVLFQRLMKMCWRHSAEERPRMEQVHKWASSDEFERLRAEINLKDVAAISCVCITRIAPDNKKELTSEIEKSLPITKSCHSSHTTDHVGYNDATEMFAGRVQFSASEDSCPVEEQSCSLNTAGLRFQPLRASPDPEAGGDEAKQRLQSYTQIWLCSRGLLQIFTYYDGQPGAYTFSGLCSKDEVLAICPVGNTVWMGTSIGTLKIFHAPTLQAQYASKLDLEVEGLDTAGIIEICHVKEACSVLVATGKGEIWSFLDHVVSGGLKIQDRILPPSNTANITCNRMVTVNYSQESVEVWGTMSENRIFVLKPAGGGLWRKQDFEPTVNDSNLRACLYIAHASFSGRNGLMQNHVWHSYRSKAVLVCWDAETKQQRHVLDCAKAFKEDTRNKSITFQVEALNAHGQKVFVGTSGGTVGVFNSETCSLMKFFSWYMGKVQALLVLPKEAEHCICAEIPYDEEQHQSSSSITASQSRNRSQSQTFANLKYIPNREPEAVMIISIGEGGKRFAVNEPSSIEGAAGKCVPTQKQNVCLQMWRASC